MENGPTVTAYFSGENDFKPEYKTENSAGMDIKAWIDQPQTLSPGERVLIPAGFRIALPKGWEAQVRPRSGLALKEGITVLNSPGTIDADYRGPVGVILINHGKKDYTLHRGDRIAQLIIQPAYRVQLEQRENLPASIRGDSGFGSTGR